MRLEKKPSATIDPLSFERRGHGAHLYADLWNQEIPETISLDVGTLPILLRASHSLPVSEERYWWHTFGTETSPWREKILISRSKMRRGHQRVIVLNARKKDFCYSSNFDRLSVHLMMSSPRSRALVVALKLLEEMRGEENEPDFTHRPSDYSLSLAKHVLETAYTQFLGLAPEPAAATDGEGGLILEWKKEKQIVRLIIASSENGKSYIYTRGVSKSELDYSVSGLALSQKLYSIFAA